MADWSQSNELGQPAVKAAWDSAKATGKRGFALQSLDQFYQTMSDADVCSTGTCATWLKEAIDPSLPDLPSKTRDDFIIGRTLLEADEYAHPTTLSKTISMALKSRSRAQLGARLRDAGLAYTDKLGLCPINEPSAISELESSFHGTRRTLTRMDMAHAFDPIAVAPKAMPAANLDPSVFDRTIRLIVLDVAPWVRGIVAFEHRLMQERLKLSNILSDGGTRKRMRNTRSAYSALEGGERKSTRREQYFGDCLTTELVLRTGGDCWQDAVVESYVGGQQVLASLPIDAVPS
jgi:hypothetical protein